MNFSGECVLEVWCHEVIYLVGNRIFDANGLVLGIGFRLLGISAC
jgi:hypothetical protein